MNMEKNMLLEEQKEEAEVKEISKSNGDLWIDKTGLPISYIINP